MAKKIQDQTEAWGALAFKIGDEGFDYALINYSDWDEIEDKKFHTLRDKYQKAHNDLLAYIETQVDLEF